MPRKYSMERRSASLEETRSRIVEATLEMHSQKGILATSMQDIAARAGVSLGTVYRHFPTMEELIPACGALILERVPPPTAAVFQGLEGEARLRALIVALYDHYDEARMYETGYAEAPHIPVLQQYMQDIDARIRALCEEAAAPFTPSAEALAFLNGMARFQAWLSFNRSGLDSSEAAKFAANAVVDVVVHKEAGP